jgi:hypothetical protein
MRGPFHQPWVPRRFAIDVGSRFLLFATSVHSGFVRRVLRRALVGCAVVSITVGLVSCSVGLHQDAPRQAICSDHPNFCKRDQDGGLIPPGQSRASTWTTYWPFGYLVAAGLFAVAWMLRKRKRTTPLDLRGPPIILPDD